jgi:hypothetical protein
LEGFGIMKSLAFLHCLRCKYYGVILWKRYDQIVDATGACLEPRIPDDTDAKILINMIKKDSELINEEYRDAVASRFDCYKRHERYMK